MSMKFEKMPSIKSLVTLGLRGGMIDVYAVAKKLGVIVEESSDLDMKGVVSSISFYGDKPIIRINLSDNTYSARKRFNIAYQLGNYYCNKGNPTIGFVETRVSLDPVRSLCQPLSMQARRFAFDLLMPVNLLVYQSHLILNKHRAESCGPMSKQMYIDLLAKFSEVPYSIMNERIQQILSEIDLSRKAA